VFDFAVNSGPARAAKFLQRIVGVNVDGRVGPKTIEAAHAMDAGKVAATLCDQRLAWLKTLKTWPTFGKGWTRRVADVRATSLAWVGKPADVEKVPVDRPTVPETVDDTVRDETSWWQKLIGFFGFG